MNRSGLFFMFPLLMLMMAVATTPSSASELDGNTRSWTLNSQLMPRPIDEGRPEILEDPELLKQFVHEQLRDRMESARIPGAVFVAVLDGEVVYVEGFGYENIDARRPIDPETTMFHVASISKTFLGTAAMRFVDQGLLNLDDAFAEVAPALRIQRRTRFDPPVTVWHSLVHSSGFYDLFLNSTAPSPEQFEQIVDVIPRYLTAQAVRAGQYTYYCNICISMTAAAMELVSGKSYADILYEEVFQPLGMRHAALNIPTNPRRDIVERLGVTPYVWDNNAGTYRVFGEFLRNVYPAGSIAVSASDMANFMKMHMNGGIHEGERYLSAAAHGEMHRHQNSNHEKIPGYRITFKEGQFNGVKYYGHSGDFRGVDSTMQFLPDYNFGFFLSYTGDNDTFYRDFVDSLLNTAFPSQLEIFTAAVRTRQEMERFSGSYTYFRYDEPSPMQLVFPLFGQITVSATDDGLLRIKFPAYFFKGGEVTYAQVSENLFRKVDHGEPGGIGDLLVDYLVFDTGASGTGKAFRSSIQNHSFVMVRVAPWREMKNFQVLLGVSRYGLMVIVALGLMLLFVRVVTTVLLKRPVSLPVLGGTAGWSILASALAGFVFLLAFFYTLENTLPVNLTMGFDNIGLTPYFLLPPISLLLFAVAVPLVVRAWLSKSLALHTRAALTIALLPLATWLFLAYQTHLMTFFF